MTGITLSPPSAPTATRSGLALAGWVLVTFLAAATGSQFPPGTWYAGLEKPAWNPPNWIFGPVWTLLYTGMAVAAWRIWRRGGWTRQSMLLSGYLVHLVLNAAWTCIFFGLQQPGWAFAEILVLATAIALLIRGFWTVDRPASLLLVPYLAWVSFAAVLNFTLWRLNSE